MQDHALAGDPRRERRPNLAGGDQVHVAREERLRVGIQRRALAQAERPAGRRLDFLAQELSREANTLCAKSNDASLTALGLELRVEIEQFREQVQNIE